MNTVRFAPLVFVGGFLTGCREAPTWSAEAVSPDQTHIARGHSYRSGGYGTGDGGQTSVSLNWTHGSQEPMIILVMPGGPQTTGEPSVVQMKWIDKSHLQLTYSGKEEPLFQAVGCAGVQIDLS